EDGIRDFHVTGVQTCALPISSSVAGGALGPRRQDRGVGWPLGQVHVGNRYRLAEVRQAAGAREEVGRRQYRLAERSFRESQGQQIGRASCRYRGQDTVFRSTQ